MLFLGMFNVAAIIAAVAVAFIIKEVWYSPDAYGKTWMMLEGLNEGEARQIRDRMKKNILWEIIAAAAMTTVFSWVLKGLGANDWLTGAGYGFILWIGFGATYRLFDAAMFGKNPKLWLLEAGCDALMFAAVGAILGAW
jgi:hypothetical protein